MPCSVSALYCSVSRTSACSLSAQAASVSRQFALGGEPTLKPAEVAAFRMRDQFDPRALETYLMPTTSHFRSPTTATLG
jgi:hypothetical protein